MKTFYMHTLQGYPASFTWLKEKPKGGKLHHVPYIYFVTGGRHLVTLVPTLRRLRYEQRITQRDASLWRTGGTTDWSDPKHYGYLLVKVPT